MSQEVREHFETLPRHKVTADEDAVRRKEGCGLVPEVIVSVMDEFRLTQNSRFYLMIKSPQRPTSDSSEVDS